MTATRRPRWPWVVFGAVLGLVLIASASFVVVRLTAPLPRATVRINTAATFALGGVLWLAQSAAAPAATNHREGACAFLRLTPLQCIEAKSATQRPARRRRIDLGHFVTLRHACAVCCGHDVVDLFIE